MCGPSGRKREDDPLRREHPRHRRENRWHPPRRRQSHPGTGAQARRTTTRRTMGAHRSPYPLLAVPIRPRRAPQLPSLQGVADTNDHYRHHCIEPTVVAARRQHHTLLAEAIHNSKLKRSIARALTAIYTLDNEGRHIDPGAAGGEVCADLVDNLINTKVPAAAPARGALTALLEMGASERMQGWFPKQFNYGMYLLQGRATGRDPKVLSRGDKARHRSRHVGGALPDGTPGQDRECLLAKDRRR